MSNFRRGQPVSAAALADAARALRGLGNVETSPAVAGVAASLAGVPRPWITARLGEVEIVDGKAVYAFQEVFFQEDGTAIDGPLEGTGAASWPAYEVSNKEDIPAGTIVRLWRRATSWVFQYCCAPGFASSASAVPRLGACWCCPPEQMIWPTWSVTISGFSKVQAAIDALAADNIINPDCLDCAWMLNRSWTLRFATTAGGLPCNLCCLVSDTLICESTLQYDDGMGGYIDVPLVAYASVIVTCDNTQSTPPGVWLMTITYQWVIESVVIAQCTFGVRLHDGDTFDCGATGENVFDFVLPGLVCLGGEEAGPCADGPTSLTLRAA